MSEEEENNTGSLPPDPPPPPPPSPPRASTAPRKVLGVPLTSDAGLVLRKASTWLALAATGLGLYCGASLGAYALAPAEAKAAFSVAELVWYTRGSMLAAGITALIPLATSIRQKAPKPCTPT